MFGEQLGLQSSSTIKGYETKIFDDSYVHTIDIVIPDLDTFLSTCKNKKYTICDVVVDGEVFKNVGIGAKGNTSMDLVDVYGNNRYSFKIEFDQYDKSCKYYGLDKITLNNMIQDNTYMKDYISYKLMEQMGVVAPLCSYTKVTINGQDWGLYLAVEAVEESFLERNFGDNHGRTYKPHLLDETDWNIIVPKPEDETENNLFAQQTVKLNYIGDDYEYYYTIFNNRKTDINMTDMVRLVHSIKLLNEETDPLNIIDTDEVIRYFVAHNFTCNFDSYTGTVVHNYYLYEDNGILSMLPWDYSLAFGEFQFTDKSATDIVNYPIDSPVFFEDISFRPMLSWIFNEENADKGYLDTYHEYFRQLAEYTGSQEFQDRLDSVIDLISPYVYEDATRCCTYEEFELATDTLKRFMELRTGSLLGQLNGTVPITYEEQQQSPEKLVDASDIELYWMGDTRIDFDGNLRYPIQKALNN